MDALGFPMVVKDRFGSFGQQVRLVLDMELLARELSGPYVPRILQRYVKCSTTYIRSKVVGEEFRGADIIWTSDDLAVCEINSNVHTKKLKNCTGRDVSHDILRRACDIVTEYRHDLLNSVWLRRHGVQLLLRRKTGGCRVPTRDGDGDSHHRFDGGGL